MIASLARGLKSRIDLIPEPVFSSLDLRLVAFGFGHGVVDGRFEADADLEVAADRELRHYLVEVYRFVARDLPRPRDSLLLVSDSAVISVAVLPAAGFLDADRRPGWCRSGPTCPSRCGRGGYLVFPASPPALKTPSAVISPPLAVQETSGTGIDWPY